MRIDHHDVDIVVPARNVAGLIGPCLDSLAPQAAAHRARVVVVDDGSEDATVEVATAHGAEVLEAGRHGGPYAARNQGWRHGRAATVVFTDARCRARPGWLDGLRAAIADPTVAVAGGDTWALPGRRLAERFASRRQLLATASFLDDEFLPYLPTCNLVTTRATLEAVDGFREVRSGGDVDFCWRVQLAGRGRVVHAPGADMDWVPRTTVAAVLSQWRRYGRARVETVARFADAGFALAPPPPRRVLARVAAGRLRDTLRDEPAELPTEVLERLTWLAYWRAYRQAWGATTAGAARRARTDDEAPR